MDRFIGESEYVVLENYKGEVTIELSLDLSAYTNEELLEELKRRMEK